MRRGFEADVFLDFRRDARHHRSQGYGRQAQAFGDVCEAGFEALAVGWVGRLAELPRSPMLHVAVHRTDEAPERFQGGVKLVTGGELKVTWGGGCPKLAQLAFGLLVEEEGVRPGRYDAPSLAQPHVEEAVKEIAEVVAKICPVARPELFFREIAVLAYIHFADEVVAENIGAVGVGELEGVGGVACALGSLVPGDCPPAVDDELAGQLEAEGVQHAWPVNGMWRDEDVLADDVRIRRPLPRGVNGRGVVDEGVEPHVSDEVAVEG